MMSVVRGSLSVALILVWPPRETEHLRRVTTDHFFKTMDNGQRTTNEMQLSTAVDDGEVHLGIVRTDGGAGAFGVFVAEAEFPVPTGFVSADRKEDADLVAKTNRLLGGEVWKHGG